MPLFHYEGKDRSARPISGRLEGVDADQVRAFLERRGWTVQSLVPIQDESASSPAVQLGAGDLASVMEQTALAVEGGLPLEGALRALAEEAGRGRTGRQLHRVCSRMESGESLGDILADGRLHRKLQCAPLLRLGLSPGPLAQILTHMVGTSRQSRLLRAQGAAQIAWMLGLIASCVFLVLFLAFYCIPQISQMFEDFGTEVPGLTLMVLSFFGFIRSLFTLKLLNLVVVLVLSQFIVVGLVVYFSLVPAPVRRRVLVGIPFFGTLYRLTALSDLSLILAALVEQRIPLPEAVTAGGESCGDADLSESCRQAGLELGRGTAPSDVMRQVPHASAELDQLLRWSALGPGGAALLRGASKQFLSRAQMMTVVVPSLLEPWLFLGTGGFCFVSIVALMLPMFKLLNDLS